MLRRLTGIAMIAIPLFCLMYVSASVMVRGASGIPLKIWATSAVGAGAVALYFWIAVRLINYDLPKKRTQGR